MSESELAKKRRILKITVFEWGQNLRTANIEYLSLTVFHAKGKRRSLLCEYGEEIFNQINVPHNITVICIFLYFVQKNASQI